MQDTNETTTEYDRLERIANVSLYTADTGKATIEYSFKILKRYLSGKNLLELGPAEGLMTELLAATGLSLTIVDGSALFCDNLRKRFPQAKIVHSLFEEFEPDAGQKFDNIVLGHVLEHVNDPVKILSAARKWLADGGRIFAAVPNARSIHRQAAVIMGLQPSEHSLGKLDVHHGHRRVFDPETFRAVFYQSGLKPEIFGGYWLKPLSNAQIERDWTPEMLEAFMQMGERYPDIAGEIYILASAA